jgi:hypothetical protein
MSLTNSGPPSALFNCAARILPSTLIFKAVVTLGVHPLE